MIYAISFMLFAAIFLFSWLFIAGALMFLAGVVFILLGLGYEEVADEDGIERIGERDPSDGR